MQYIHQLLLAGRRFQVGRHGDGIDLVLDVRQIGVPFVVGDFKGRVAGDGDAGGVQFLDVDLAAVLGGNADDVRGQVVVDRSGDLHAVLQGFRFRAGEGREPEIVQASESDADDQYENQRQADEPQGPELPVLERAYGFVVAVQGADRLAFVIERRIAGCVAGMIIVVVDMLRRLLLGLVLGEAAAALAARGLPQIVHIIHHVTAAGRGLLDAAGHFRAVRLRFDAAQAALLLLTAELALAQALHFLGQAVALVIRFLIVSGVVNVINDLFTSVFTGKIIPPVRSDSVRCGQGMSAAETSGQ